MAAATAVAADVAAEAAAVAAMAAAANPEQQISVEASNAAVVTAPMLIAVFFFPL